MALRQIGCKQKSIYIKRNAILTNRKNLKKKNSMCPSLRPSLWISVKNWAPAAFCRDQRVSPVQHYAPAIRPSGNPPQSNIIRNNLSRLLLLITGKFNRFISQFDITESCHWHSDLTWYKAACAFKFGLERYCEMISYIGIICSCLYAVFKIIS